MAAKTKTRPSRERGSKTQTIKEPTMVRHHKLFSSLGYAEAVAKSELMGTNVPAVVERLGNQLCSCLWFPDDLTPKEATQEILTAIVFTARFNPRNELEAMLAVQAVATHNAAMECMKRAMLRDQPHSACDLYLKHAEKLFRIFKEQAEVISRVQQNAPMAASTRKSQSGAEEAKPDTEGQDDLVGGEQLDNLRDIKAFLEEKKAS